LSRAPIWWNHFQIGEQNGENTCFHKLCVGPGKETDRQTGFCLARRTRFFQEDQVFKSVPEIGSKKKYEIWSNLFHDFDCPKMGLEIAQAL
jgi:hypothetical protein